MPNNNPRKTLALLAYIVGLGHALLLASIVFVGGSTISGIVGLIKHGTVPAWTLFFNIRAGLLMVPAYQRGRRNPDDAAIASHINSLEEKVKKATLEATMAKNSNQNEQRSLLKQTRQQPSARKASWISWRRS